jgi:CRISPR system Cascade subunit CasA
MRYDLLDAPLLAWRGARRQRSSCTLPGALARLASGELQDFPRLRTHQFHPWGMFLTQLAAIALHRADRTDPRLDENTWRDLLLALTAGRREPWCLVVEDLAQPAFLQAPIREGSLDGWKIHTSPDDIDVLVTAKAHDVKASLMHADDVEAWAYALVTLQTTQGFPGRGYTRISRMKGGYGNRPRVGLAPDQHLGGRFLRDVDVLLAVWPGLTQRGFSDDGVSLVWTQPWDGRESLAIGQLTPHFIEICWRVRCTWEGGAVFCHYTTTENRRCAPETENGDVGDCWAPIERDAGMLTIGSRGFHYDLLSRLLFENDFEPAAAQRPRDSDPDPVLFTAAALARGQGKTQGLHERALALAGPIRWRLGRPDTREAAGRRAAERVVSAKKMRSKVLFPALQQLGGTPPDDFDGRIDEVFFHHLFDTIEREDEDARLSWEQVLSGTARAELQRAISRCGLPNGRRFKTISAAESVFAACLRKNFPDIQEPPARGEGEFR